jgi:hypothetical protein
MKNILGTTKNLTLFDKEGRRVYRFYKNLYGDSSEYTYDSHGNQLTYKSSDGFSSETNYDINGNELRYKNSNGYSYERTYNSNGRELTYKDSDGVTRGFDIPEYTMEELVERLGNFKIKK